ncbi:MAG TPA: hypothetical protein VGR87_11550 [Candidatus Limnocylindria bacterium]|nr:hypothetical protein [Candidatus Limnocylindria bacterium]
MQEDPRFRWAHQMVGGTWHAVLRSTESPHTAVCGYKPEIGTFIDFADNPQGSRCPKCKTMLADLRKK